MLIFVPETRKGVIFHQDDARPHTSLVTRKKLLELHGKGTRQFARSRQWRQAARVCVRLTATLWRDTLNGKTFVSNEAVINELIQFFASKNQTFYESGFMKLTERWQKGHRTKC